MSGIVSDVKVYINTGSIYAAGGIVGQNGDDGVIKQCINKADVYASKASGGVCGRSYGTITECVNTGNVTGNQGGKDGIGGITGLAGMKDAGGKDNLVSYCYNTGTISNNSGRWHGGIAGFAEHAAVINNCYDIGQINTGYSWNWNPIIGHVDGGSSNPTVSSVYSLEGLNAGDTDDTTKPITVGTIKTEAEFKSADMIGLLGDAYFTSDTANINNGYPILKWQAPASEEPEEDFIIEAADFVDGVFVLSEAGEYTVASDAAGLISITTDYPVTLVGGGEEGKLANLSIQFTEREATLTIRDLWIDRPESSDTVPVIDFTGRRNLLTIEGQNYLQCSNSYGTASACIHVGPDTELEIDGDGNLSMYAGSGGSCIGGADTESNGDIIFSGGTIYAYSSRAASTIGSGQKVDASGSVTINGGELYLYGNARGACIGSGGLSGGQIGDGAPVTVTGGNLTCYVSFTGSAIGNGGGQQAANNTGLDPEPDPGTLTVSGGSIKTVMMSNSLSFWGLEGSGNLVNDVAITAVKQNADGEPVYLLTLPLADVAANEDGDAYIVTEGDDTLYSGDQSYDYTANTRGMWTDKTADANLYLYLTGEEHTLNVNGTDVSYEFNAENNTFSLKENVGGSGWDGTVDAGWYDTNDDSFTLTTGAQLAGLAAIVNGTAEGIEQDSFLGKTVVLDADINLGASIVDSETSYTVTVLGGGTKTYTLKQAEEGSPVWTPIGNADYAFKGTFDGQGHKIECLYVSGTTSYLGLFGSVGGTDEPGAPGYGTVKNFQLYGLIENTNSTALATDYVGAVTGKLNAGGTISDVINYADVEAKNTANVGAIAGFAGSPVNGANDGKYTDNPSGYNTFILRCGNEGLMHGYYKLGGIVGENASTIMYCYNNGFILPHMHGSGGGWGGICGRHGNNNTATEEGIVAYCYNTGTITNDGMNDDKNETIKGYTGISGMTYGGHGHNEVYNCYNVGAVLAGRNNYNSIATNVEAKDKNAMIHDNYSLICTWIKNNSNPETAPWETGIQVEETAFKATTYNEGDILTLLGPYYTADAGNINNGYPVLRWQVGKALPVPTSLTVVTPPTKVEYSATQTFDPAGMVVKAVFDDNSVAIVSSDVEYSTEPLAAGTESITLSYTFNGATVTATQAISVENLSLSSIAVTTVPTKTIYADGQTFDKDGMVITATFNDGAVTRVLDAEEYVVTPDPLTAGLTEVTVSYTYDSAYGEQTETTTQAIKVMEAFPEQDEDGFYLLEDVDDMLWFTDQVGVVGNRTIKGKLVNDIDLSEADWQPIGGKMNAAGTSFTANANTAYLGEFDGDGHTLTIAMDAPSYAYGYRGVFAYLSSAAIDETTYTAYVHDLTVAGAISATGASYIAGVAAYNNAGVIENCVNKVAITSTGSYTAGIVGFVQGGGKIVNCVNAADITAGSNAGGIAAYVNNGIIEGCLNSGSVSGSATLGGIAGYATNAASVITECANLGDVTGSGNNVGGIIGQAATANIAIERCYNEGTVAGSAYVGGIAGTCSALITDCYNRGDVTGSSTSASVWMAVGGIAGVGNANSAYTNTYSSGAITAANGNASGIVGASNNAIFTITNSYWLEDTAAQAYLERTEGRVTATDTASKTAVELQALAATLGENYKTGASFPILTWQDDEEAGPMFIKHALLLSDEIGVKFRVSFPEGFDDTDCYVDFVAEDGRTLTVQYDDAETITDSTDRYFTFAVNALELADKITATLYYGDGQSISDEYSVMTYITYIQKNYADNEKLLNLVNALQEYGYYMQGSGWTDDKASHTPIPALAETMVDVEAAKAGVSDMAIVKDLEGSGIADSKFSLTLNTKTAINVSVKPESGVKIKTTGYKTKKISGATYYQYTKKNIGPKNLGTAYPFVVETSAGRATVTASAMSYVYAILNNTAFTDAQQQAMAALYYYYVAAAAF